MFFTLCEYAKSNLNSPRSVFLGYLTSSYYYTLLDVPGFIRFFFFFFLHPVKVGEYMAKEIVTPKYSAHAYFHRVIFNNVFKIEVKTGQNI